MIKPTKNYYKFKYLITAISGEGLQGVYLPDNIDDYDIVNTKEDNCWVRPKLPSEWKTWRKEEKIRLQRNPDYVDPRIEGFIDREWRRRANGVFFYNDNELEYLTGFHYWLLTHWEADFGFLDFRDDQKEYLYFSQYCEEDPDCYGDMFNTLRRGGKSLLLGGWEVEYATRTFGAYCGNQGEDGSKIKKFYLKNILQPYKKLPDFFMPIFNDGSGQQTNIQFIRNPRKRLNPDEDEPLVLGGWIDYQPNGSHKYDMDKLHRYGVEEPGKTTEISVYERWDVVKFCLRLGRRIIGKAKFVTTVDQMEQRGDVGGKSYEQMFYHSDFDKREEDGRTKTGLYASFMPADCAYEGNFDEYGKPMREKTKREILTERKRYKNDPKKLAGLIRKLPLTIREIFYVDSDKCEFNAQILNEQREYLLTMDDEDRPIKGRLEMSHNGTVVFERDDLNGWLQLTQIPHPSELNKFEVYDQKIERIGNISISVDQKRPLNNKSFVIGLDPIQHGVKKTMHNKRSMPVAFIKKKYDANIDGVFTPEIADERRKQRYKYKTGIYIGMMDDRPEEPNVLYDRLKLICLFFGCQVHVESQRGAVIDNFKLSGMGDFIMSKFNQDRPSDPGEKGTHASPAVIQMYTSFIATYVQYFGHTILFQELVDNLIYFNAADTELYDYAVAMGYTEMGERNKDYDEIQEKIDISELFDLFNNSGSTSILN